MPQGHRQLRLWGRPNKRLTEMIMITSGEVALCGLWFSHRRQICSYMAVIWSPVEDTAHLFQWGNLQIRVRVCLSFLRRGLGSSLKCQQSKWWAPPPPTLTNESDDIGQSLQVCFAWIWSKARRLVLCVSCNQDSLKAKASLLSRTYGWCKKKKRD